MLKSAGEVRRQTAIPSSAGDRPAHGELALGSGQLSCVGPQAEIFFSEDAGEVAWAKRLCSSCPQRDACLAGALERREPWGVWGGELFHAGAAIPRKRPRGRPRRRRSPETTPSPCEQ